LKSKITNESYELARHAVEHALSKKAKNPVLMDLRPLTSMTDYFIVCHGDSDLHVKAIANAILDNLRSEGHKPWHVEGITHLHWVLLDFVDVVVHVFDKEARDYYGIEGLWGDAECESFEEEE
jgi:ribosome-associated protein